jgi:protein-S-isoprenylcysteine O-methyltransferase
LNFDAAMWMGIIFGISEIGLSVRRRASSSDTQLADRGSLRLLWITIMVCNFLAYFIYFAYPQALFATGASPIKIIGLAIYAAGLCLRWYSIIYLGRFFTVNVAIATDHQLIDAGPYRYVRHPSYTGALMAFIGIGLALANWASLAILVIPIFFVFSRRIRVEEAALQQGLGVQYRRYMDRTKRLVPGLY